MGKYHLDGKLAVVVEVVSALVSDKPIVRQMMELYFHDLSEFEDIEINKHGRFGYHYLDQYWVEDNRHPFIVRVEDKLAGFVLVNDHTLLPGGKYAIAEFFVLRKYRRCGVGRTVACYVFDMFRGQWESHQTIENTAGQQFWRCVIGLYTDQNYRESTIEERGSKKIVQSFENHER